MAPTNIKTVHQTSLLHIESSLDRLGLLSPTHDQCSQQQRGQITLQPVLIKKSKATYRPKIRKIEIPRSMVVEALAWAGEAGARASIQPFKALCVLENPHAQGFSPPLARRRSSCPPPSPNLVRTHSIENYQALRDSAPSLSRAATLPKGTKLELGRGAHLGAPCSANHTAAASQPTDRIAKAASWLHLPRTKVNGSYHGDNPLLRPTWIQIATKSYVTLPAMALTNIKIVHQTSLLHIENSLD